MQLDISPLEKSLRALEHAVEAAMHSKYSHSLGPYEQETLKSGLIHNFETAYELCWKFMKRWLEKNQSIFTARSRFFSCPE